MRQQLRQLSGDTAIYGITTIIQRFLTFFLTPLYTHLLTREEFGIQASVFVVIAFIMVIAGGGMEAAFFKFSSTAAEKEGVRPVFWNAIIATLGIAATIALAMILLPGAVNSLPGLQLDSDDFHLIRMAGAIVFLDAASTVALASLRMERRAKQFSVIRVGAIVVNIALNIWLVAVLRMGVEGVFIANLAQSAIQLLMTLPTVARHLPFRIDRPLAADMLRFGLPTLASGLAAIALQVVDRPIIDMMLGKDAVGLYQANFRLGIVMMLFVSVFEFAWRPFFLQQASKPNAKELYARVFTYFNLAAAALFLLVSFYIVNIANAQIPFGGGRKIIGEDFLGGLRIVPVVLAAYIFNGWYTNFIVGVYIEKKTKSLLWITGGAALVNVLFCFLLIPTLDIIGAAWAKIVAYIVMALGLLFYIRRFYPISYEWGRVARIGLLTGAIWTVNLLLLDFDDTSLRAALIRLALLAAFPVGLLLTGFFGEDEKRGLGRIVSTLRRRPA